jgi:hypothetical protein
MGESSCSPILPTFVCCILACFSCRRALVQARQSQNCCILPLLSCSANMFHPGLAHVAPSAPAGSRSVWLQVLAGAGEARGPSCPVQRCVRPSPTPERSPSVRYMNPAVDSMSRPGGDKSSSGSCNRDVAAARRSSTAGGLHHFAIALPFNPRQFLEAEPPSALAPAIHRSSRPAKRERDARLSGPKDLSRATPRQRHACLQFLLS